MLQTKLISNLYNPHQQSPEELIGNFVVRLQTFRDIFNDIKSSKMKHPDQHYIIQAPRGAGKTTLLLRIYYEILNDRILSRRLIPIIFPEEQFFIRDLNGLWESVAENLQEYDDKFTGLKELLESMQDQDDYSDVNFGILVDALRKRKKKLILFIDNIGDMLNKFSDEEHARLREILSTSSDIRLIGASSVILEHTFDYSQPFFEFFRFISIGGLTHEETVALLLRLADKSNGTKVKEIVAGQPERVEALRRLTSGSPRTIVLLFEIFADDQKGDSYKDLDMMLDRVTPLYKHRMEDLSKQQQWIVDAIAMNWDAVSTGEIAAKTKFDSKAVSAQLRLLEKNRVVRKIETTTKNHLYQVEERFFNIWYLMRYGKQKERNKVLWLVKFLQEWCSQDELIERARKHMNALSKEEYDIGHAYIMTEALARTGIPMQLQHDLLEKTKAFLGRKDKKLRRELSKSDIELHQKAFALYQKKDYSASLKLFEQIYNKTADVLYRIALNNEKLQRTDQAEKYYLMSIDKGNDWAMLNLANLYKGQQQLDKAEKYYLMSIDKGNDWAMLDLADLYKGQQQLDKAEKYCFMSIDKGNDWAMLDLANMYKGQQQFDKAEKYYLMSIDKGNEKAMYNLALLYQDRNDFDKTEKYYLMAADRGHVNAMNKLAQLYFERKTKREIALDYMERAAAASHNINHLARLIHCQLWNNKLDDAIAEFEKMLASWDGRDDFDYLIRNALIFFIAKKQTHFVHQQFEREALNLKDRFKPVYYALMHFMRDKYPNEYRKMGDELRETVGEVIEKINRLSIDYA